MCAEQPARVCGQRKKVNLQTSLVTPRRQFCALVTDHHSHQFIELDPQAKCLTTVSFLVHKMECGPSWRGD